MACGWPAVRLLCGFLCVWCVPQWVRSKIPEYNIKNFSSDWIDGRAMAALVNAVGMAGHLTLGCSALQLLPALTGLALPGDPPPTIPISPDTAGEPWLIPNHNQMLPGSARKNAATALDTAEEHLGIPKVTNPSPHLANPAPRARLRTKDAPPRSRAMPRCWKPTTLSTRPWMS
jgi:hypothetical protein